MREADSHTPAEGLKRSSSRNRWTALILGVIAPPIAMLYLARPLRAAVYLAVAFGGLALAVFLAATWPFDALAVARLFSFLVSLIAAADAYRLARAWTGASLPWYARWFGLAGVAAGAVLSVFLLRGLIVEPYRIPSASMAPTLRVGDHILASKTSYGWDIPFTKWRFAHFGAPGRGDVAVFRYPPNRDLLYVMRVVGIPGDTVEYRDKRLRVNGHDLPVTEQDGDGFTDSKGTRHALIRLEEKMESAKYSILQDPEVPLYHAGAVRGFDWRGNCQYTELKLTCRVPADRYFVMGDNRDYANDSRYWGFVPGADFVGRVFVVWYSAENPHRAGVSLD